VSGIGRSMVPCYTVHVLQSQSRGQELDNLYILLGLVPAIFWLAYCRIRGRRRPGSFGNVLRVFFFGCLGSIPVGIVGHITGAQLIHEVLWKSAAASFLVIAPLEEFFKLLAVWIGVYRSQYFSDRTEGIFYSTTAALGFASVENLLYLSQLGPEALILRVAYATPAHIMFSAMWGYSMGVARFRREGEFLIILSGFLAAVFFHGAYNFFVALDASSAAISVVPIMIFMAWVIFQRIRRFRRGSPFPSLGEGPMISCPTCGAYTSEEEETCVRCGGAILDLEVDAPRFCGHCRALLDPCRDDCPRCRAPVALKPLCAPK
jgi:protease PrsW